MTRHNGSFRAMGPRRAKRGPWLPGQNWGHGATTPRGWPRGPGPTKTDFLVHPTIWSKARREEAP